MGVVYDDTPPICMAMLLQSYLDQGFAGTLLEESAAVIQKTREGCGCFWGLCGSSGGKFWENSGKIAGKCFLNREML